MEGGFLLSGRDTMITISLCMIVRDEEEVLARCLESVQGIADEIIVVDTGSKDRTPEIARQFTEQVFSFPWVDDFAAARNFSFSKARMDYILWLDADDVLEEGDRAEFLRLKEELDPSADVVMLPYHIAFDEAGRPAFTYERERLLKRERGFRWQGAVHEVIVPAGKVVRASASVSHRKMKAGDPDRNLRIFEQLLARGEKLDPRQQYYYARELAAHGRDREAAGWFTGFLERQDGWIENKIGACLDLAACYRRLGEPSRALAALTRSFAFGLPRPEICCALGEDFLEAGRIPEAVCWYQAARHCPPPSAEGFCQPDYWDFIPCVQLCVCYDRMGDRERALRYHEKAKRLKPENPSVLYNERYFSGQ